MNRYFEQLSRLTMDRMGFDGAKVEQGSPEWGLMRLGVITASRASDLIAVGRPAPMPDSVEILTEGRGKNTVTFGGKTCTGTKAECVEFVRSQLPPLPSAARTEYLLELVAEVATGQAAENGSFKQTQWGHEHEASAREIFAFHVGVPIVQIPFLYGDATMRYGCSPDGLNDERSGTEIKCPWTTKVFLDFLLNGEIKSEYLDQVQFSMFVTGMPFWHFANFDPRMRKNGFHAVTIERDEAKMATFKDAVGQMTYDMDRALERLDMKFGDQWVKPAVEEVTEEQATANQE